MYINALQTRKNDRIVLNYIKLLNCFDKMTEIIIYKLLLLLLNNLWFICSGILYPEELLKEYKELKVWFSSI